MVRDLTISTRNPPAMNTITLLTPWIVLRSTPIQWVLLDDWWYRGTEPADVFCLLRGTKITVNKDLNQNGGRYSTLLDVYNSNNDLGGQILIIAIKGARDDAIQSWRACYQWHQHCGDVQSENITAIPLSLQVCFRTLIYY